ncbi:hypothetical protein ACIQUB_17950 [Rhizobium sp. NPDC090275]|uniref:hypothetical protein n=1 Tax=Rhizobium sp. NPDC090275 TaxID=3364498 RepID=UPI00383A0B27
MNADLASLDIERVKLPLVKEKPGAEQSDAGLLADRMLYASAARWISNALHRHNSRASRKFLNWAKNLWVVSSDYPSPFVISITFNFISKIFISGRGLLMRVEEINECFDD